MRRVACISLFFSSAAPFPCARHLRANPAKYLFLLAIHVPAPARLSPTRSPMFAAANRNFAGGCHCGAAKHRHALPKEFRFASRNDTWSMEVIIYIVEMKYRFRPSRLRVRRPGTGAIGVMRSSDRASVPIPKFAKPCSTTDANFGIEGH